MSYIDGFVVPVPADKKAAYRELCATTAKLFKEYGATAVVECWGDDVPDGKVTDFKRAVAAEGNENVVFSWIVWPDRAARDAGNAAVMVDPDLGGPGFVAPFDGIRMIYGGFDPLLGDALAAPGVINGTVLPVPAAKRKEYTEAAVKMGELFREYGATSVVDAWGDDLPEGKVNSFHTAVLRKPDEAVVFSWINWKDQAAHDAGWERVMADPRMAAFNPATVGADMGRMIYGTFTPLVVA